MFAASCSMYRDHQRAYQAGKTESSLQDAGFRRVPIESPAQDSSARHLPLYQINRYEGASGAVYWYVDPDLCQCLFIGDEAAYQRYAMALEQENETAEYVEQGQSDQLAMLSPFSYAFPPPIIFGAWPPYYYQPPSGSGGDGGGGGRGGGAIGQPHGGKVGGWGGGAFGQPGGGRHGGGSLGAGHGHR